MNDKEYFKKLGTVKTFSLAFAGMMAIPAWIGNIINDEFITIIGMCLVCTGLLIYVMYDCIKVSKVS